MEAEEPPTPPKTKTETLEPRPRARSRQAATPFGGNEAGGADPRTIRDWARAGKIGFHRTLADQLRYWESEVRAATTAEFETVASVSAIGGHAVVPGSFIDRVVRVPRSRQAASRRDLDPDPRTAARHKQDRTSTTGATMRPMTAAQWAEIDARLDELMEEIRDLSRRLDVVTSAPLPAPARLRLSVVPAD